MTSRELNDLGLPLLTHWIEERCQAVALGDIVSDTVSDVDCPGCWSYFDRIKRRQKAMRLDTETGWLNRWFSRFKLVL